MEEIQELKRIGYVGYRLENSLYFLVDFRTDEVLNVMSEVAILYDDNVLLKHGCPDKIYEKYLILRARYNLFNIDHNLEIIQGPIPIEELDKALSMSDYKPKLNGLEST